METQHTANILAEEIRREMPYLETVRVFRNDAIWRDTPEWLIETDDGRGAVTIRSRRDWAAKKHMLTPPDGEPAS